MTLTVIAFTQHCLHSHRSSKSDAWLTFFLWVGSWFLLPCTQSLYSQFGGQFIYFQQNEFHLRAALLPPPFLLWLLCTNFIVLDCNRIALHVSQFKIIVIYLIQDHTDQFTLCLKQPILTRPPLSQLWSLFSDWLPLTNRRFGQQVGGASIHTAKSVWQTWHYKGYPLSVTSCRPNKRNTHVPGMTYT